MCRTELFLIGKVEELLNLSINSGVGGGITKLMKP
jgi:hypothetical protein